MSEFIFGSYVQADLEQILQRREERRQEQAALLALSPCVVSFTLNIPGNRKAFPLADACFEEGLTQILSSLSPVQPESRIDHAGVTGREALLAIHADAAEVKRKMVRLEEEHPLGRVWDIDVLGKDGRSLSRRSLGRPARPCLICGGDAKACARSRAHAFRDAFAATYRQMDDYFLARAQMQIADCAEQAMLQEVSTTPKPGLVDRSNSGAHKDMDYQLFLKSIQAISPYFRTFVRIGWEGSEQEDAYVFAALRSAGQQAESAMFQATNGINTHKGFIFSAAILCAALGRLQAQFCSPVRYEALSAACAKLAHYALSDFNGAAGDTAGLRLYQMHQLQGVRGEAAAGFPSVFQIGYPALLFWLKRGASLNNASAAALLYLIAAVEDTNLVHRGGKTTAVMCRKEAEALLRELTVDTLVERLTCLDKRYIEQNLSPGGCADLLALSLLIYGLEKARFLMPEASSPPHATVH